MRVFETKRFKVIKFNWSPTLIYESSFAVFIQGESEIHAKLFSSSVIKMCKTSDTTSMIVSHAVNIDINGWTTQFLILSSIFVCRLNNALEEFVPVYSIKV